MFKNTSEIAVSRGSGRVMIVKLGGKGGKTGALSPLRGRPSGNSPSRVRMDGASLAILVIDLATGLIVNECLL